MAYAWNVRRYHDGDEKAIVELLNVVYGWWHNLEFWRWKYTQNPGGSPIIWLAECDKKIIAHYAIIPLRMKIGNSYMTGSIGGDAATHPEHEGKGVFSSIVNRCYMDAAENDIPLTFGMAQIHLGPIYKRYEWRGHISFMENMTKALAHNRGKTHRTANVNIERISRFDEEIDEFWEETSKHFNIVVGRHQKYLNWRYADHPEYRYAIYTATKDHKIVGYCVLCEAQHEDQRIGFIEDVLGSQHPCNVVYQLIQWATECFEKDGVDTAVCTISEGHPYKAILRRAGFVPCSRHKRALVATMNLRGKSIDERQAYSQALTLSQNPLFKEKRNWFMMSGDGIASPLYFL